MLYEDIRVKDAREKRVDLKVLHSRYSQDAERGLVRDVQFRDVRVVGGPFPVSIIRGYDDSHRVEQVSFDGLVVHGQRVTSANEARMVVELARNVRFRSLAKGRRPGDAEPWRDGRRRDPCGRGWYWRYTRGMGAWPEVRAVPPPDMRGGPPERTAGHDQPPPGRGSLPGVVGRPSCAAEFGERQGQSSGSVSARAVGSVASCFLAPIVNA